MLHQIMRVVQRMDLDLSNIQASQSAAVRVTPPIDISQYNNVALSVNVYSRSVVASGSVQILVLADSSTDYAILVNPTPLATVTIDSTTSQETVLRDALDSADLPATVSIWVQGTQPANGGNLQAEFDADLILRQQ